MWNKKDGIIYVICDGCPISCAARVRPKLLYNSQVLALVVLTPQRRRPWELRLSAV